MRSQLALASMSTLGSAEEAAIDQEQSRKPEQEAQQDELPAGPAETSDTADPATQPAT